ncbi:hypothetical protein A3K55_01380 [Candidatus Shapirobacteria bacterium RBG_13_44_7]|uniref:Cytoplasmic protein n=1 Tax=Candidatus Shapirobacteria bacterium RBG_13_44_7 TaxID=1802149 RepID=A0A1F7SG94_9BACT|nr:MAG: hypothetical protein A3K55_01380 [Candidatus Shapirobacteria bacterium RBG_13_44_7]
MNMPNLDKTGPQGQGPMTGRGFGPCGSKVGWGKRICSGRGLGKYFRWNWPKTKKDQTKALAEYKQALLEELEDVKKEEEELDKTE